MPWEKGRPKRTSWGREVLAVLGWRRRFYQTTPCFANPAATGDKAARKFGPKVRDPSTQASGLGFRPHPSNAPQRGAIIGHVTPGHLVYRATAPRIAALQAASADRLPTQAVGLG
jgi:hypothetical protein